MEIVSSASFLLFYKAKNEKQALNLLNYKILEQPDLKTDDKLFPIYCCYYYRSF